MRSLATAFASLVLASACASAPPVPVASTTVPTSASTAERLALPPIAPRESAHPASDDGPTSPLDVTFPAVVHREPAESFALDPSGRFGLAASREGHVSLFETATGRVRAVVRAADGNAAVGPFVFSEDGSRALVGTRDSEDPPRLFAYTLRSGALVDLLQAFPNRYDVLAMGADARQTRVAVLTSTPPSEEDSESDGRYAQRIRVSFVDERGRIVCASEPLLLDHADDPRLFVAPDGSSAYLGVDAASDVLRIDATTCATEPFAGVAEVLAMSPRADRMLVRTTSGIVEMRSLDGSRVLGALDDLDEVATDAVFDRSGEFFALVLGQEVAVSHRNSLDLVRVRVDQLRSLEEVASDGSWIVCTTYDSVLRVDVADGSIGADPRENFGEPPPAGHGERTVWGAFPIASRRSIVVTTSLGALEWSASGVRRLPCGERATRVVESRGTALLLSASGFCNVATGARTDRSIFGLSDDRSLALVFAPGETGPVTELLALPSLAVRATIDVGPMLDESDSLDRAPFTTDGRFVAFNGDEGAVVIDTARGRRVRLPLERAYVVRRTDDGRAFAFEGPSIESGYARIDPRAPTRVTPLEQLPPFVTPSRDTRCDGGVERIVDPHGPFHDAALGSCESFPARIVGLGERAFAVVREEAVTVHRLGTEATVTLRATWSEADADAEPSATAFAVDHRGAVYVDGQAEIVTRRAGDARTAAIEPAVADRGVLATLGSLLEP